MLTRLRLTSLLEAPLIHRGLIYLGSPTHQSAGDSFDPPLSNLSRLTDSPVCLRLI